MKKKNIEAPILLSVKPFYNMDLSGGFIVLQHFCFDPSRVGFNPFGVTSMFKYTSLLRHY